MHLPVPDPRKSKKAKKHLAQMIIDKLGLHPDMRDSVEMTELLDVEVLPMFDVLDSLKNKTSAPAGVKGTSIRKLIGQAQLRHVESAELRTLLDFNNSRAVREGKLQYVYFLDGKEAVKHNGYVEKAKRLVGNDRLTPIQVQNLELNLQLVEMEEIRHEKGTPDDDDVFVTID